MRDATPAKPGSFCWPELAARDAEAARAFYGSLLGWAFREVPGAPGTAGGIFEVAGREVAGISSAPFGGRDAAASWGSYVAVADAADAARRVETLGGTILVGPRDVGTSGRMAVVRDPQGAALGLWEAKGHPGIALEGEVGSLCWTELGTTDVVRATRFYGALFGWTFKESAGADDYTEIASGGTFVGGLLAFEEGYGAARPAWVPYFRIDDCDATVAEARALRARALGGPSDLSNLGRYAYLCDPQGAMFAVISFEAVA